MELFGMVGSRWCTNASTPGVPLEQLRLRVSYYVIRIMIIKNE